MHFDVFPAFAALSLQADNIYFHGIAHTAFIYKLGHRNNQDYSWQWELGGINYHWNGCVWICVLGLYPRTSVEFPWAAVFALGIAGLELPSMLALPLSILGYSSLGNRTSWLCRMGAGIFHSHRLWDGGCNCSL